MYSSFNFISSPLFRICRFLHGNRYGCINFFWWCQENCSLRQLCHFSFFQLKKKILVDFIFYERSLLRESRSQILCTMLLFTYKLSVVPYVVWDSLIVYSGVISYFTWKYRWTHNVSSESSFNKEYHSSSLLLNVEEELSVSLSCRELYWLSHMYMSWLSFHISRCEGDHVGHTFFFQNLNLMLERIPETTSCLLTRFFFFLFLFTFLFLNDQWAVVLHHNWRFSQLTLQECVDLLSYRTVVTQIIWPRIQLQPDTRSNQNISIEVFLADNWNRRNSLSALLFSVSHIW